MKHVIFVSQSKLSQNLMTLIVKSIPRKMNFHCFDRIEDVNKNYFPKSVQLAIVDKNTLSDASQKTFTPKAFRNAKIVLIHTRDFHPNREQLKTASISDFLTKPFLSEELVEMIENKLGYKK